MDRRSFLSGFGAGLACAAGLMLALSGFSGDAGEAQRDAAEAVQPQQAEEQTVAQAVAETAQSPEPPVPPQPAASPQPVTAPDTPSTGQPPASSAQASPKAVTPPAKPEVKQAAGELVTFTVQRGMSSTQVARMLVNEGVLTSAEPFLTKLREQDKLGSIRVGTYRAPRQANPDELIRLLTTPPGR